MLYRTDGGHWAGARVSTCFHGWAWHVVASARHMSTVLALNEIVDLMIYVHTALLRTPSLTCISVGPHPERGLAPLVQTREVRAVLFVTSTVHPRTLHTSPTDTTKAELQHPLANMRGGLATKPNQWNAPDEDGSCQRFLIGCDCVD